MKITFGFSQRTTMTANESVLSKDVKIVPTLKDVKFTREDGTMISSIVEASFKKALADKRWAARKRG